MKSKNYWLYIPAVLLAVTTVYPLLWTAAGSFNASNPQGYSLIPAQATLLHYISIFTESDFLRYFLNTLVYAGIVTVISLFVNSMAGYSLARLNYPGKNVIFIGILSTMMIPFSVIMIPLFLIMKTFGMVDSLGALILPSLVSSFGIFLLRQFYIGIPRELEEAAKIDGLSYYGIYTSIVLPLSKPIFYALAIFSFLGSWNNYLWPLIVNSSEKNWVLTTGIASFSQEHSIQWNSIMAAAVVSVIPTLIIFAIFQKQLVEGIKMTGFK